MSKNLPSKIQPDELIIRVRGQSVILDADLAALYGVETKRLNQQYRRNKKRFPEDFAFQLSEQEWKNLRLQFATSRGHGGRRVPPFVFTEHGAIMVANVLHTEYAEQMSVTVVRAFVRLRRMALSVEGLARKVNQLEKTYDKNFQTVFQAIRQLMAPDKPSKKISGFRKDQK